MHWFWRATIGAAIGFVIAAFGGNALSAPLTSVLSI
jgi:hypothetical protein